MVDLERRVFVGNLAYRTTCDELKEHFSKAGKVKKAEVYYDHSGRGPPTVVGRPVSKGCGVVEFEDEADAKYAVKELTETMLDGRAILVREDREQPPPSKKHDAIPDGGSRPGDWICPKCSDMQFASRRECRSCGEPRPTTSKARPVSFGANDWTCPACGDHQFARNVKCRQCGEPKPSARRRNTRSRSSTRSRSRRSRRGDRRSRRHRVKKRESKEKRRGKSKRGRERKVKKSSKDKIKSKKSRKDKEKRKEKKRRVERTASESYSYDSSYDASCYSSE